MTRISPEHFEVVVIDEFHHAEAATYRKILDYLQPRELLGLTATPERGDGHNVQKFFDYRVVPMSFAYGTHCGSNCWRRCTTTASTTIPTLRA